MYKHTHTHYTTNILLSTPAYCTGRMHLLEYHLLGFVAIHKCDAGEITCPAYDDTIDIRIHEITRLKTRTAPAL